MPETYFIVERWWLLKFRDVDKEETNKDKKSWRVPLAAVGLLIIVLGIIVETYAEGRVSDVDALLRAHESDKITAAEGKSASAIVDAGNAKDSAVKAKDAAAIAEQIAQEAMAKSDTFEKRIVSATNKATEAERHLAEALREAAAAQKALSEFRAPRNLSKEQAEFIASQLTDGDLDVMVCADPSGPETGPFAAQLLDAVRRRIPKARWFSGGTILILTGVPLSLANNMSGIRST